MTRKITPPVKPELSEVELLKKEMAELRAELSGKANKGGHRAKLEVNAESLRAEGIANITTSSFKNVNENVYGKSLFAQGENPNKAEGERGHFFNINRDKWMCILNHLSDYARILGTEAELDTAIKNIKS